VTETQSTTPPQANKVRRFIYRWLFNTNLDDNYAKSTEKFISLLIVANLLALIVENIDVVFQPNKTLFHIFDVFSLVVFTIEYVLRFYTAPEDEEFKGRKLPRLS